LPNKRYYPINPVLYSFLSHNNISHRQSPSIHVIERNTTLGVLNNLSKPRISPLCIICSVVMHLYLVIDCVVFELVRSCLLKLIVKLHTSLLAGLCLNIDYHLDRWLAKSKRHENLPRITLLMSISTYFEHKLTKSWLTILEILDLIH
jgi:hypothetical protein